MCLSLLVFALAYVVAAVGFEVRLMRLKLETITEEVEQTNKDRQDFESYMRELDQSKQAIYKLTTEKEDLERQKSDLERQLKVLEENHLTNSPQWRDLMQKLKDTRSKLHDTEEQLTKTTNEKEKLERKCANLKNELQLAEKKLNDFATRERDLKSQIDHYELSFFSRPSDLENDLQNVKRNNERLRSEKTASDKELQKCKAEKLQVQSSEKELEKCKYERSRLQTDKGTSKNELDNCNAEKSRLRQDIADLHQKINKKHQDKNPGNADAFVTGVVGTALMMGVGIVGMR